MVEIVCLNFFLILVRLFCYLYNLCMANYKNSAGMSRYKYGHIRKEAIMNWPEIDEIYTEPTLPMSKGIIINLSADVEGDLDEFESCPLGIKAIIMGWSYENHKERVKPFQLLEYSRTDKSFLAVIKVLRKSKHVDELKLLCVDINDVCGLEGIVIKKWTASLKE